MNEKIKSKAQELYPVESRANEHTAFLQGAEFVLSKPFIVKRNKIKKKQEKI